MGLVQAASRWARRLRWPAAAVLAIAATAFIAQGRGDPAPLDGRPSATPAAAEGQGAAARAVGRLTRAQKVDQLIVTGFSGTDATAAAVGSLEHRRPGGLFVSEANWQSADQGAALLAEIDVAAGGGIPPLLVTSQEGGFFRRLSGLPPSEDQLEVGSRGSPAGTERWARGASRRLREVGLHVNLGLLADVAPLQSPVGDRTFGADPQEVAPLVSASLRGCVTARLACGVRHFPGLGGASQDTDEGPATVSLSRGQLDQRDLVAFRAAIDAGAPIVVLSHAFYAPLDPVTPASLSPAVATDLLRGELGFEGVAITDDLEAGAIRAGRTPSRAAVEAVNAGADMVLIEDGGDAAERARMALLDAARSGALPQARLEEAVGRVLRLKASIGLLGV